MELDGKQVFQSVKHQDGSFGSRLGKVQNTLQSLREKEATVQKS